MRTREFFRLMVLAMACLLPAAACFAQLPELPRAASLSGAGTNARFFAGATAHAGSSYRESFGYTEAVDIEAAIAIDPGHVGTTGNLFLVVAVQGQYLMRTTGGKFVPWRLDPDTLVPAVADITLTASEPLPILENVSLGPLGLGNSSLAFFLAYNTLASPNDLFFSASPLRVRISGQQTAGRAFTTPQMLTISGYNDHAMEPFISRDGYTLFFNNLNDPEVNTNLHYATRVDALTFAYGGELAGVNTAELEGVPTMAADGTFVFTAASEQGQAQRSLMKRGSYADGVVTGVELIAPGPLTAGNSVAMGGELSPDGDTLFVVETVFTGDPVPAAMDLRVAYRIGNDWDIAVNSESLMAALNTPELEYAPAISADGLTLYFTRAEELVVGNEVTGTELKILMATRNSREEPFAAPVVIDEISGFVEGPTVGPDDQVYFHKRVDGVFRIFVTAPQ